MSHPSQNLIGLLSALALGILLGMVPQNVDGQDSSPSMKRQHYVVHGAVEEKAQLLQDNNQDTYRALADEIFKATHGFEALTVINGIGPTKIPASIDNVIKDRLVYAEMQYRQGRGKGVAEQSIVDFTNLLAQKLNLPDYAQTSPAQVRHIRMWLISVNPSFMGHDAAKPNMQVGESISSELSPLQATHLLLEVLGHKLFDPDFQVAPADWDRNQQKREEERRSQPLSRAVSTRTTYRLVISTNPRGDALRAAIAQRADSMTFADVYSLIDQAMTTLGIER